MTDDRSESSEEVTTEVTTAEVTTAAERLDTSGTFDMDLWDLRGDEIPAELSDEALELPTAELIDLILTDEYAYYFRYLTRNIASSSMVYCSDDAGMTYYSGDYRSSVYRDCRRGFNALRELETREDAASCLLQKYLGAETDDGFVIYERYYGQRFMIQCLELLLGQKIYYLRLTDAERTLLLETVEENHGDRSVYHPGIYVDYSHLFYMYYRYPVQATALLDHYAITYIRVDGERCPLYTDEDGARIPYFESKSYLENINKSQICYRHVWEDGSFRMEYEQYHYGEMDDAYRMVLDENSCLILIPVDESAGLPTYTIGMDDFGVLGFVPYTGD